MGLLPKRKPVPAFTSPTFPPSNTMGADSSLAINDLPSPTLSDKSFSFKRESMVRRLSMALTPSMPTRLLPQARESRTSQGDIAELTDVFGLRMMADEPLPEEEDNYLDEDDEDLVIYSEPPTQTPRWLRDQAQTQTQPPSPKRKRKSKHHSSSTNQTTSSKHRSHDLIDESNAWDFQFSTPTPAPSSLPLPTHPLSLLPPPTSSPPPILLPSKSVPIGDGFDALDVMADHLFRYGCEKKKWFKPPSPPASTTSRSRKRKTVATGVSIRATTGIYRTFPPNCEALDGFEEAVRVLNPEVAFKISSPIVTTLMGSCITPNMVELTLNANARIQILDTMTQLRRARKHQYAAFIRSEGVLVVWADDVSRIIGETEALEACFIEYIWRSENDILNSVAAGNEEKALLGREDKEGYGLFGEGEKGEGDEEVEDTEVRRLRRGWRERPVRMYSPMIVGLSIVICLAVLSIGVRKVIKEYLLDGQPLRFALLPLLMPLGMVLAFACATAAGSIWQIIGPVRQMAECSSYFSAIPPKRTTEDLPHVTVWLPIFRESLEEVIIPTVESLKRAIMTYERQGGSVGVFVCDDGLQLISPREADERRKFYFDNDIAYVARPGNGVNGFHRRGRFKKASNLNFGIRLSLRVEEILDEIRPEAMEEKKEVDGGVWNDIDEHDLYEVALETAVDETKGEAWARGNIRIGEVILLIDSDTRVPEDCFLDAVSEMSESPNVAIIQHASGVIQVANHFFENGIAHFTRLINVTISFCCANGEIAPFVGHNAFLRWSALQECIFTDDDGLLKVWSEDHVSEDFSIALTLQMKGYVIRWATYSEFGFLEGVSLSCDDELNRWQKYAYGASEIMFNPFSKWFHRGPFTPLFRSFIMSDVPIHYKASTLSYLFSYYAIGSAWPMVIVNYFVMGFNLPVDDFYVNSWNTTFVCLVLFSGITNVAAAVLRYRIKFAGTSEFLMNQFKYLLFFGIFFLGISMHVLAAIGSHMVGYNMTWGATVKTVTVSNFFKEVPALWKRYWISLIANSLLIAMMIVTSISVTPIGYRVFTLEAWLPLGMIAGSHVLYPIVLNPWLLQFSF